MLIFFLLIGRYLEHRTRASARSAAAELMAMTGRTALVVMPDGNRGFFTNNEEGPAYAKYLGEEVIQFIERTFPARSERSARAIGGVSMGGYGALRVGLAYSEKFCSIHSHSGSLDHGVEFKPNPAERTGIIKQRPDCFVAEMRRIFGERPKGTEHDILLQAIAAKQRGTLPNLWVDCGLEDYLLPGTRSLHEDLKAANIPHTYHEFPGCHDWEYCNAHIAEALVFHATNLNVAAVAGPERSTRVPEILPHRGH